MEMGLFVDGSQGQYVQSIWVAGIPDHQRFFGIKSDTLNLTGRTHYPVTVYRCPNCGLLQAFALPKDEAKENAARTLLRAAPSDKEPSPKLPTPPDKEA